jgi:hypothetical protein
VFLSPIAFKTIANSSTNLALLRDLLIISRMMSTNAAYRDVHGIAWVQLVFYNLPSDRKFYKYVCDGDEEAARLRLLALIKATATASTRRFSSPLLFDPAAASKSQRRFTSHLNAPNAVSITGVGARSSQVGLLLDPSRYRVAIAVPPQQAPYRASGFVH